ncbi:hypothetical protein P170DRAFT_404881 [Aspergillus steynii IBT 23096]|uniref:Arrestin-like N-terminal domain-containing protein n=1 Tax=Aspergillus steynii IBT 23096 TaxID=1392250 RepID=A0A2I2GB60_9EURO|nr:uncharacterized protein P170DRAFT_404881 [Aspergillus steynii IBT 23096]PLB50121.1 hypothetical protein P170DRAFT_404881 [Aspergillus steynii IBT 23096]
MASSIITRGSSTLEAFTSRAQPKVTVDLQGQTEGLVNTYTTGDRIEGTATITVDRDVRFDDVEITFEGTSRTSVERTSIPGRTGAYQTFLRLRQPIDDTAYPTPRVLEPNRTYQFPFTFVVPERLLPHACSHRKTNVHVERSHTLLPPTLGDAMLASDGKTLLDDISPDMCRIAYLVRVTVLRRKPSDSDNASSKSLASVGKKVRVVPAVDEEPPLNVEDHESTYCTRKEKDVKRGLLRGKLGRLVVAATQPKPVRLNPPATSESGDSITNNTNNNPVSTAATLHLRFDPVGTEAPPRLGTVWSKLRVSTYFGAEPWPDYPSPSSSSAMMLAQMGRGSYTESVPLSTLCLASSASAGWTRHEPPRLDRCASRQSSTSSSSSSSSGTDSLTGPSASFDGDSAYYTASVVVPLALPSSKTFVPSFHSCLISRVYALDLSISYHTPNANILTPTVSLRIPLQFTCARRAVAQKDHPHEISIDEVNAEFFNPRSVAPPPASSLPAPPDYSEIASFSVLPDRSQDLLTSARGRVRTAC